MEFSCGTLIFTSRKPRGYAEHSLGNTCLDCQFKHTLLKWVWSCCVLRIFDVDRAYYVTVKTLNHNTCENGRLVGTHRPMHAPYSVQTQEFTFK